MTGPGRLLGAQMPPMADSACVGYTCSPQCAGRTAAPTTAAASCITQLSLVSVPMLIDWLKGTVVVTLPLVAGPISLGAQQGARSDSSPPDTLRPYALAPVVVTASRIPASQLELGFATSVLERRDLVREPTPYAARALTFLPGVSIDEASGPGGPTWLHLRGGDEPYTQLMFDGVPINISGGYSDIAGLLLTNVERIEIARGPLSALWGSSAVAGAVQFITREARVGPPQFELLAEGGGATEHGAQARSELTVAGGAGRVRYSSGVGFAYNRGIYALPNDLLTSDASLRLDAAPAQRWTLTATARYMATQTNATAITAGSGRSAPAGRQAPLGTIASRPACCGTTSSTRIRRTARSTRRPIRFSFQTSRSVSAARCSAPASSMSAATNSRSGAPDRSSPFPTAPAGSAKRRRPAWREILAPRTPTSVGPAPPCSRSCKAGSAHASRSSAALAWRSFKRCGPSCYPARASWSRSFRTGSRCVRPRGGPSKPRTSINNSSRIRPRFRTRGSGRKPALPGKSGRR